MDQLEGVQIIIKESLKVQDKVIDTVPLVNCGTTTMCFIDEQFIY
jgi:hypothetical protein